MTGERLHVLLDRLIRIRGLANALAYVLHYEASAASLIERAEAACAIGEAIAEISSACSDDLEPLWLAEARSGAEIEENPA